MSVCKIEGGKAFSAATMAVGNKAFGAWARMAAHASRRIPVGTIAADVARRIAGGEATVRRLLMVQMLELSAFGYSVIGAAFERDFDDARRQARKRRVVIAARDGDRCFYCRTALGLTVDHYIPLSRGGSSQDENLRLACSSCNSSKGDRMPHEWRRA